MLISQKENMFLLFRKLLIIFAVLFLELLINNKFSYVRNCRDSRATIQS